MNPSLTQHLVQTRQRLRGLGEENHAAYRTVNTVHHPQKNRPGFGIALLEKSLDLILQSTLPRRIRLYEIPGVLVHHEQVVVFVEYIVRSKHPQITE